MKLTTTPPGGHLAVLQTAVEVHCILKKCVHAFLELPYLFIPLSLKRATTGAVSTRHLTAKAGRASYIAAERLTLPDPGAVAVAAILRAVLESLEEQE